MILSTYFSFCLFYLRRDIKKIFPRPISKSIQSVFSSRNLWFQVLHLSLLWEYIILILLMFANLINEKVCLIFFLTFSCLQLNKWYFFLWKLPVAAALAVLTAWWRWLLASGLEYVLFFWHLACSISVVIKSSMETLEGILQKRIVNVY